MAETTQMHLLETAAPPTLRTYDDIAAGITSGDLPQFDALHSSANPQAIRATLETDGIGILQKTMRIAGTAINAHAEFYGAPELVVPTRKLGRLYGFADFLIARSTDREGDQTPAVDSVEYLKAATEPFERASPISIIRTIIANTLAHRSNYLKSSAVAELAVRIWTVEHSSLSGEMTSFYDAVRAERYADRED